MKRYRATVYVLRGVAAAVEGYAGLTRRIVEELAVSEEQFKNQVRDLYALVDVDCEVSFGPISQKQA